MFKKLYEWEYQIFSFQRWQPSVSWSCFGDSTKEAESFAQRFFWDLVKYSIMSELGKYSADRWEPEYPIGPALIKLRKVVTVEHGIQLDDLLLAIMTCGISLLCRLLINKPKRYVSYYPVELRVRLLRPRTQYAIQESTRQLDQSAA